MKSFQDLFPPKTVYELSSPKNLDIKLFGAHKKTLAFISPQSIQNDKKVKNISKDLYEKYDIDTLCIYKENKVFFIPSARIKDEEYIFLKDYGQYIIPSNIVWDIFNKDFLITPDKSPCSIYLFLNKNFLLTEPEDGSNSYFFSYKELFDIYSNRNKKMTNYNHFKETLKKIIPYEPSSGYCSFTQNSNMRGYKLTPK